LVGAALAFGITWLVNRAGIFYDAGMMAMPIPLKIGIYPATYVLSVAFLAVLAALAAVLPAREAARARIPDALTHV